MKRARMARAARRAAAELITIVLGILLALWIGGRVPPPPPPDAFLQ